MYLLCAGMQKDLRRFLRDPVALMFWLALPLGIGIAITLATGGAAGPKPIARLFLVNEDQSLVSDILIQAFRQAGGVFQVEPVERAEGRRRLDRGEGTALLILAKGFGEAVLAEKPFRLELITNPEQRILPQMVEELLQVLRQAVFYLHRLAGNELKALAAGRAGSRVFSDADIARISIAIHQTANRLQNYLYPPAVLLETAPRAGTGTQANISMMFLPGILLMSLLFMAQGLSDDIWKERNQGTLRRWTIAPGGPLPFLIAKLVSAAVLIFAVSLIILSIGMAYHGLPFYRLPLALLWSTVSGLLFLSLMQFMQLYASSQRAGAILATCLVFPLMILGGSMFPLERMPAWMAAVGRCTPNGWALELLKDILLGRSDPTDWSAGFAGMALLSVAASLLTVRRIPTFARN